MGLDPRLHAFRPDLADARLKGEVEALRYTEGEAGEIVVPAVALRREPKGDSTRMTEGLFGEKVTAFHREGGWAWVQLRRDGYVGYVEDRAVAVTSGEPTHRVSVPRTFVYPNADLKSEPARPLYLNSELIVEEAGSTWSRLKGDGWVFSKHLMRAGEHAVDAAAVAETFLNVPYLWGGKTQSGLDCSGLAQISLHAAGHECPRDTDMMERALGRRLEPGVPLQRGDLVFWKGHVGIVLDEQRFLHANGFHMLTIIEPLARAVDRIRSQYGEITSVRRLEPRASGESL